MAGCPGGISAQGLHVVVEVATQLHAGGLVPGRRTATLPRFTVHDLVDQRAPRNGIFSRQAEVIAGVQAENAIGIVGVGIELAARNQRFECFTGERPEPGLVGPRPVGRVFLADDAAPLAVRGGVHRGECVGYGLSEQDLGRRGTRREGHISLVMYARFPHVLETRQRPGVVARHEMGPALGAHSGVERHGIAHGLFGEGVVVKRHLLAPLSGNTPAGREEVRSGMPGTIDTLGTVFQA